MAKPKTRSRIGTNPLDAVLAPTPKEAPRPKAAKAPKTPSERLKSKGKVRATFHLPADLFDEVRDCVVHLQGDPAYLRLATFAESAIRAELEKMKRKYNDGKPFKKRRHELVGGRPIGT